MPEQFKVSRQHLNILEPSLQMRGRSPLNYPDSDVKEWGLNIGYGITTNGASALFQTLMLLTSAKVRIIFEFTMERLRSRHRV